MARATGLEPATSGVTGRHSNQLSYARAKNRFASGVAAVYGRPPALSSDAGLPKQPPPKRRRNRRGRTALDSEEARNCYG